MQYLELPQNFILFLKSSATFTPRSPQERPNERARQLTCFSRLWHQLTLQLFAFLENPLSKPYRVNVFEQFVRDFEARINQLRLVELGVKVSKEIDSEYQRSFLTYH